MLPTLATLPLQQIALVLAAVIAASVVRRLDRLDGRRGRELRTRFIAGVPWGTLVSVWFVVAVYLFLQDGLRHWFRPTVVPFTAWSYTYPLGMVTAPFSHSGPGHLVGNLIGTLTYAPLVEYAWGHFPRDRGTASFRSWRTNPYVRAFVVFPGAVIGVGLATSAFGLGPVIGFSGVVFAFAGFALLYYPFTTILALVAGRALRLAYGAFLTPVSTVSSRPVFSTPWFADIALQGHALGFLIGVLFGLGLSRIRGDDHPSAVRLWIGVLFFAISQSLWAVYWFRGNGEFVLYRAGGLALVMLLATLVTAGVRADRAQLFDRWTGATGESPTGSGTLRGSLSSVSSRQLAVGLLLLSAAALAGPAVGVNLLTVADDDPPNRDVAVRDYRVTYAENVQNSMVAVVDVDAFGETTTVNASGVIVQSADRNIWMTAVSKSRLAFDGTVPVRLGGLGWRDAVLATRDGWEVEGGEPVYRVALTVDGETTPVYSSDSAQAEPVLAGRNVSLDADSDGFYLLVASEDDVIRERLPAKNETVTLAGIEFTRENRRIVAATDDGTRVRVATKEEYQ